MYHNIIWTDIPNRNVRKVPTTSHGRLSSKVKSKIETTSYGRLSSKVMSNVETTSYGQLSSKGDVKD